VQEKIVTLTTPLSVIKGIAARRQQYIRSTDVSNHKRSPDTDLKVEIDGLIGEFAVQQYFGVRSTPVNLENRPDGGIDLVIDGHTVDVKFSQYLSGDLCFKSKKAFKAKRAILAVPVASDYLEHEYPVVRLAGWVRREEFLSRCLVHREPSELKQQWKTWHGVGMTQPAGMVKNCMECSYHYSPIHQVTT
jgi:hypothetical protein